MQGRDLPNHGMLPTPLKGTYSLRVFSHTQVLSEGLTLPVRYRIHYKIMAYISDLRFLRSDLDSQRLLPMAVQSQQTAVIFSENDPEDPTQWDGSKKALVLLQVSTLVAISGTGAAFYVRADFSSLSHFLPFNS